MLQKHELISFANFAYSETVMGVIGKLTSVMVGSKNLL